MPARPSRRPLSAPIVFRALRSRLRFGLALRRRAPGVIIPGGLDAVAGYVSSRETPYTHVGAIIPAGKLDLQPLKTTILPEADPDLKRRNTDDARKKYAYICSTLPGLPELLAVHALAIAVLRRRDCPPRMSKLFLRMWREEGAFLAAHLPARWLISAATTFADIGQTPEQRQAGQCFALAFDLIKLHDSERRLTGRPNSLPFPLNPSDDRYPLAFDLDAYSLSDGDLEFAILVRLHRMAEGDPVFRPLGRRMLELLMTDNRTVFARIQKFKTAKTPRGNPGTSVDTEMGHRQHD